ncbi:MAG: glycine/betaine ABC transporter substrate-binding protein [Firmicutes bacterium]|nr:glycine/betaine ABC transporter substrate-binding protein [Bacillota bacterium]
MRRLALLAAATLAAAVALAGCGGSSGGGNRAIVVGSKNFTENIILGEMIAQLIEAKTDYRVERKLSLGGTDVTFKGLRNGDLDVYVEYDGTAYAFHLGITDPIADPAQVYDLVNERMQKELGMKFTQPFGLNNTYTLAMPAELAQQHGIRTYSDLARVADQFILGVEHEFLNREHDGYPGLEKAYGFRFKQVVPMETGLKYKAIEQGEVQVINAFATDGMLKKFNLVILEDDKGFFPPYNAAPLVRLETLEQFPELEEVLNLLGGQISDEEMRELNYLVDEEGRSEAEVAREFLRQKGLID